MWFTVQEKLPKDSGVAGVAVYDTIVAKLLEKRQARGVIVYGSDQEVGEVVAHPAGGGADAGGGAGQGHRPLRLDRLRRVERPGARHAGWASSTSTSTSVNKFSSSLFWKINPDTKLTKSAVTLCTFVHRPSGQEEVVEGTISLQPMANEVKGFQEYFLALHPRTNTRNPWFVGEPSQPQTRPRVLGAPLPVQVHRLPPHPLQLQLLERLHGQGAPHQGEHRVRGAADLRERRGDGVRARGGGATAGGVRAGPPRALPRPTARGRREAARLPQECQFHRSGDWVESVRWLLPSICPRGSHGGGAGCTGRGLTVYQPSVNRGCKVTTYTIPFNIILRNFL